MKCVRVCGRSRSHPGRAAVPAERPPAFPQRRQRVLPARRGSEGRWGWAGERLFYLSVIFTEEGGQAGLVPELVRPEGS